MGVCWLLVWFLLFASLCSFDAIISNYSVVHTELSRMYGGVLVYGTKKRGKEFPPLDLPLTNIRPG